MDSIRRGWRAEARTALLQEMQQQERVYTQRARYKTNAAHKPYSGDNEASSKYDIVVDACDGRDDAGHCIRLTANLRSGFSDPAVGNIWVESTGLKGCDGSDENRCWQ
jgi:type IV pilus assembly protein PilE